MAIDGQRTVLIVDDDPAFSFELGGTLKAAGFQVVTASAASEANSLLQENTFDVTVMDLDLPDKSGLELIHNTRRLVKDIKIVATTGVLSDLHLEIARYMGADVAVRKYPGSSSETQFPAERWREVVSQVLELRKSAV